MIALSLLGPPGSGKTSQAYKIADFFDWTWISPGHLFRSLEATSPELFATINEYTEAGTSVPTALTYQILHEWFRNNTLRSGLVFDSHPRNEEDYQAFKQLLNDKKIELKRVFYLKMSEETAIQRLHHRSYIENRADETLGAVQNRFDVFKHETLPLIESFRAQGLLSEILTGHKTEEEIWSIIKPEIVELINK